MFLDRSFSTALLGAAITSGAAAMAFAQQTPDLGLSKSVPGDRTPDSVSPAGPPGWYEIGIR